MTDLSEQTARGPMSQVMRRAVFSVWNNRCAYCLTGVASHVDHVVPLARGGADDPTNYVAACDVCNMRKSDNLLAEGFCQIVLAQAKNRAAKVKRLVDAVPAKQRRKSAPVDVSPVFVCGLSADAKQALIAAEWSRYGVGRSARLVCSVKDPAVARELHDGKFGFAGFQTSRGYSAAFVLWEVGMSGDVPICAHVHIRNPNVIRALRLCVKAGADTVSVPLSWHQVPWPVPPGC